MSIARQFFFHSFRILLNLIQSTAESGLTYRFEEESSCLVLRTSDGKEAMLDPAFVRRNDTSATSINEWTGERQPAGGQFPDDIKPSDIQRVGNYAVLIMWEDGFNQVPTNGPLPSRRQSDL